MLRDERIAIIGAGIGGLAAALHLAVMGLEVTLFERGTCPGGKMSGDLVGEHRFDGGPTVLTFRDVFEEMFANAGADLSDYVSMAPLDILARHAWSATEQFDLCADVRRSSENVGRLSGAGEARRFLDFCKRAKQIFQTLDHSFIRANRPTPLGLVTGGGIAGLPGLMQISPFATMWRELGKYFHDPRLRQLFGRYATYCGSSPFEAPATLMLVAHAEQSGVWIVEGGMYRLAQALAALAKRKGVTFRYQSGVRNIDVRQGRVRGLTLEDEEWLPFDRVIFNGDAAAIAEGHLGADATRAVPQIDRRHRSLSAVTWTALAETKGFPLTRHNVFFSRNYRAEFEDIFLRGKPPSEPTVYVCAQDRDDRGLAAPGPERLLILTNAPPNGDCAEPWEIEPCQDATFRQLERCGLNVSLVARTSKTKTPQDFDWEYPATGGALYGQASHGWMASFRRPGARSRISGLYLAGGSVHPGPGVPMAALSGRLAAQALIRDLHSTAKSQRAAMPGGTSMH